jgi:hypothetical protein
MLNSRESDSVKKAANDVGGVFPTGLSPDCPCASFLGRSNHFQQLKTEPRSNIAPTRIFGT